MIMENIESELPNIVYAFDNSECQTGGHLLLDPTPFYMLSALVSRCLTACESSQQYNAVRSIMKTSINIYGPVTSDTPPEAATVTTTCSQPARRSLHHHGSLSAGGAPLVATDQDSRRMEELEVLAGRLSRAGHRRGKVNDSCRLHGTEGDGHVQESCVYHESHDGVPCA